MKQPNRIIQLNKEIRANAATIVIAAVLLYVVISVVSSLSKESVTIYQVSKGDVSNDITLQGLAIRDEVIVNTQKSGYLCYYITDGEKVKKNSTVCTIDETGEIYNTENNSDSNYNALLSSNDYASIRSLISSYKLSYSDVTFYNAYSFETSANNKVFELTATRHGNKIECEYTDTKASFKIAVANTDKTLTDMRIIRFLKRSKLPILIKPDTIKRR